jgi:hypothetical protein
MDTVENVCGLYPTIISCNGCRYLRSEGKANENWRASPCRIYDYPEFQHTRIGGCAMDTRHVKEQKEEFKLNPLKASKRGTIG